MCICRGQMCTCISNMKFLKFLFKHVARGEVCTDANAEDVNNTNDDDGQSMMHKALWLKNPMGQNIRDAICLLTTSSMFDYHSDIAISEKI